MTGILMLPIEKLVSYRLVINQKPKPGPHEQDLIQGKVIGKKK